MKKTILKTVVATAVVAATMVVSSVATFAEGTVTYNFANTTNSDITAIHFDAGCKADEVSFCTDSSKNIALFSDENLTVNGKLKPILVDYTHISEDYAGNSKLADYEKYLSSTAKEGTLTGTKFTHALVSGSSGDGTNKFVNLTVAKDDTIEIYYFGADSHGAPGKAST